MFCKFFHENKVYRNNGVAVYSIFSADHVFKNKRSEMTVSKDFLLASSGCTPFFLQTMFSWRNLQNKMDTFYSFESSIQFASFCFANFSMKSRSTEKMEYTTTKPTKNPSKLSSQFFLFLKPCHRDFLPPYVL